MESFPYLVTIFVHGKINRLGFDRDINIGLTSFARYIQLLRPATCACDIPKGCKFPPVQPETIIIDFIPGILIYTTEEAPANNLLKDTDCENCAESGFVTKLQFLLSDNLQEGLDNYWSYLLLSQNIDTTILHGEEIPGYHSRRLGRAADEVHWIEYINPDTEQDAAPSA